MTDASQNECSVFKMSTSGSNMNKDFYTTSWCRQ